MLACRHALRLLLRKISGFMAWEGWTLLSQDQEGRINPSGSLLKGNSNWPPSSYPPPFRHPPPPLQVTCYVQVTKEAFSSQKRTHQIIKLLNFFYFCGSFLPSWIRIRILNTDPDSLTRLNPDPRIHQPDRIRSPASGSATLPKTIEDYLIFCRNVACYALKFGSKIN